MQLSMMSAFIGVLLCSIIYCASAVHATSGTGDLCSASAAAEGSVPSCGASVPAGPVSLAALFCESPLEYAQLRHFHELVAHHRAKHGNHSLHVLFVLPDDAAAQRIMQQYMPTLDSGVAVWKVSKEEATDQRAWAMVRQAVLAEVMRTGVAKGDREEDDWTVPVLRDLRPASGYTHVLMLDNSADVTRPDLIDQLQSAHTTVVAPLLTYDDERVYSNFWGARTSEWGYKRSSDYVDIVARKHLQQPHSDEMAAAVALNPVVLVKTAYLLDLVRLRASALDVSGAFVDDASAEDDFEVRFAQWLEKKGIAPRVDSRRMYGHLLPAHDKRFTRQARAWVHPTFVQAAIAAIMQAGGNDSTIDPLDRMEHMLLHPQLYSKEVLEDAVFDPSFLAWYRSRAWEAVVWTKRNVSDLPSNWTEPTYDVYSLPLLRPIVCQTIVRLSDRSNLWSGSKHEDPRLGKGGYENVPTDDIHLNQLGVERWFNELVEQYLAKAVQFLYSRYRTKAVHLSFVVKYSMEKQRELKPHHDASVYTLNVALNPPSEYTDGGCHFLRQGHKVLANPMGSALLHPSRLSHAHEGLPISSGKRYILVAFIN